MLPAFGWQAVLTQWEFAPVVTTGVIAAGALYLWGTWRVRRRHPARPWPAWRTGMFLGGLAVIVIATQSGIAAYDDVLFWDHMIQHLLLIMIAPPLLVAGQPATLLLHASRNPLHDWVKRVLRSRVVSVLTWPPVTFALYLLAVAGTHPVSVAQDIVTSPAAHNAEHVLYLVVGYLFFLPLIGREPIRWRISYPARLLILVLAMPVDTFTGLLLTYANRGLTVSEPRPPGSPGPVTDVHWAGATMWIAGDAIMLAFMLLVFLAWSRDTRPAAGGLGWLESARKASFDHLVGSNPAVPADNAPAAQNAPAGENAPAVGDAQVARAGAGQPDRGDIDDDEHLAAYNAYLARLNQPRS